MRGVGVCVGELTDSHHRVFGSISNLTRRAEKGVRNQIKILVYSRKKESPVVLFQAIFVWSIAEFYLVWVWVGVGMFSFSWPSTATPYPLAKHTPSRCFNTLVGLPYLVFGLQCFYRSRFCSTCARKCWLSTFFFVNRSMLQRYVTS